MEIVIAKRAGFCFGVKRAVEMAFKEAKKRRRKVCTLGPIIHNPQVVEKLSKAGVKPVEDPVDADAVLIRTHGVPEYVMEELKKRNIEIIDATCPFVKKAQHYAKLLRQEGYQVIILGDGEHPEVKGILSYAGEDAIVINGNNFKLPKLKDKVGVVVQTTQPIETLRKVVDRLIQNVKELKVYNTICNSTALRLKETEEIANSVEAMIVVGGKNSANTKQLANLCRDLGRKTFHIEEVGELKKEMFEGIKSVGITAGASTPSWIIEEVVKWLQLLN